MNKVQESKLFLFRFNMDFILEEVSHLCAVYRKLKGK